MQRLMAYAPNTITAIILIQAFILILDGRSVYFYLDSYGAWRMAVSLPQFLKVQLGDNVTIEMDTDRPYSEYPAHKKKYPPKKHKKHKKNKW